MAATMIDRPAVEQTKLDAVLIRALGDLSAGYGGVMVSIGNKLGLYKAMSGAGPITVIVRRTAERDAHRPNCRR